MKYKILLVALVIFAFAKAQVSTTSATPTASEAVTILFNAVGTPLENTTQTLHLYAGVTINGNNFQKVKGGFFSNDPAINPTFTKTADNMFRITLGSPTLNDYYDVDPATETITAIDLVIRNANGPNGSAGSESNKPLQTADYQLPIFQPGLNAVLTSPSANSIYQINQNITISGESSQSADLELSINNTTLKSATGTTISSPYTFTTPGNYTINLTATNGNGTDSDTKTAFVPSATENGVRPAGLKNGVNENADGSVTFLLAAPGKTDATLLGSFTDWNLSTEYQMKKDGSYFWLTVPANTFSENTEFTYQYLVNFQTKIADPFSTLILDPQNDQSTRAGNYPNLPTYPTGQTTGDVTIHTYKKTPYNWNVTNFQRPNKENLVIYELLVRDFSEEDSYQGIIDNIDYIANLGVNAVEFMPLNEFGGNDSWGYDPKYHGALDKAYGTPEKFKELVDLLHSKGIAVILDVVYNQVLENSPLVQLWPSTNGNGPGADNPYVNERAPHRVLEFFIDFNHESPWTKEYVKQTTQYFMDEFKIDGFRFDLSKGFTQKVTSGFDDWGRRDDSRIAILNDYKSFLLANNASDTYLILEHLADNDEETILANDGFMMWGKMTEEYKENSLGYSGTKTNLLRAYSLNRGFNNQNLVSYAESHDEERLVYSTSQFGNLAQSSTHNPRLLATNLDRQEAIAAIQYSIPGPKMLWQFGELGYDIPIDQNGRTGRKPIPFSNGYSTNSDRLDLYNITSEMIKLKLKYPETFNATSNNLELNNGLIKRVYLDGPEFDVIVVANFDLTSKNIAPKYSQTGIWYDYFAGTNENVTNQNTLISIPAGGYKVLSTKSLNTTASISSALGIESLQLFPNPTTTRFRLNKTVQKVFIYNVTGQMVKQFDTEMESYDVADLSSGIYVVQAMNMDNSRSTIKLIKK